MIVLAETCESLEHIEAICALPGLKALMIGPFDLSVTLGRAGDGRHPQVVDAIARMVRAAADNHVPAIMPIFAPELADTQWQVAYWRDRGVNVFTIGTHKILLHSQASRFASSIARDATHTP